jgi:hypothetical protein
MKKFNNRLAGTDCGDAGLPAHRCDTAKAKPVLRVVARTAPRKDAALDLMVRARSILNVDEDGVVSVLAESCCGAHGCRTPN